MASLKKTASLLVEGAANSDTRSMTDLAQELGLSISTVSRALSGHPGVRPATKARVLKLAQHYQYQPNQLASALRKGQTKLLGIVVPHIEGRFFPSVVQGIETAASKAGYSAIICQSNEDAQQEQRHLDILMRAQVAGVLVSLARGTHDYQYLSRLRSRGLPMVFFDRVVEGIGVNSVVLDDRAAGYISTQHLLSQGCQRIAHIAGPQHLNIYKSRLHGYLDALREANLVPDERLIVATDMMPGQASAAMRQLLDRASRPDGLFAASDYAALDAMREATRRGLRVPADVAITGFSNDTFTAVTVPALTTVDQCPEEMGRAAVRLLLDVIDAGKNSYVPRKVVLLPKLLVRGSSLRHGEDLPDLLRQPPVSRPLPVRSK